MGRRKDDPLLQAAKGFPGRRTKAVEREIQLAADAAAAIPATVDDPFPVPPIFANAPAYWREAIRVWAEKSAVLKAAGRRRPGYRHTLARYCIWTQMYFAASEQLRKDLPKGGAAMKFTKGDGNEKIQLHPNIDFMAKAETVLRLLDAEFGFTPMRDNDLVRVESFNAGQGKLALAGVHPASGQRVPDQVADPMDLMTGADSPPPGVRPN